MPAAMRNVDKRWFVRLLLSPTILPPQTNEPLKLEKTIELPNVQGRSDHMSLDLKGQRLFVSVLGDDTVEVIKSQRGWVMELSQSGYRQGTYDDPFFRCLFRCRRATQPDCARYVADVSKDLRAVASSSLISRTVHSFVFCITSCTVFLGLSSFSSPFWLRTLV